ncbi:DNA integrity scanning protein DisA nucleotide-binding domain protein [Priestia megaterium]|uniref:DNA integrity scanning protein DisA nucleotide-binding domain protein n=1 Tax=Priestia megaterium TaxID=1404 RepID=UPI003BA0418E
MHNEHKDINNYKSFEQYFDGTHYIDYRESLEDLKDYIEKFGYEADGHDMKYTFVRHLLIYFLSAGEKDRVFDMLDQLHILQYNQYLNKVKREFNKFDPSKKWSKRLKKVYFVQFRPTKDKRFLFVHPYTNFVKNFLDSDGSSLFEHRSNLNELINEFDNNQHDVWVGEPISMGDLNDILESPPVKFPVLFFEKDYSQESFQFFDNYRIAWESHWDDFTFDEIGRHAASLLDDSLYRAFPELNIISATPYEGDECKGYILIGNEIPDIELREVVRLNEHKRIRKLLEVSDKGLILLVKPYTLIAYGFKVKKSSETFNGIFIEFKNKLSWYCSMGSTPIFQSDNFQIKLPIVDTKDDNTIEKAIRTVFNKSSSAITNTDITLLNKLVAAASEQKKGTIIVILEREVAMIEAERLTQSSTVIKPKKINIQLLKRLSGIDGAIILDTKGICHAFGVILDGKITKGDPGRGARFNSAHRYFETKKEEKVCCLLVVVSEDGHVSVLPDELEIQS